MLKLTTETLGRLIRADQPIEELAISTYDRLREAVKAGDKETALKLIDYASIEGKGIHDLFCDWTYVLLTWIAENNGEEKLPDVFRYCKERISSGFYDRMEGLKTVEQKILWFAEGMRAHSPGDLRIWEEKDRYVMSCNPCGSGGRMRRKGADGTPARTEPPFNLGKTKKAYPWSWSLKDVPYYCLHCSLWHEIMVIEATGYPTKITDYNVDPNGPCKFYFYKKPEQVPEEYYKRIGLKKPRK